VVLVAEVAMPERWPAALGALAALSPRSMFWAGADPGKGLLMLSFGDCVLERLGGEATVAREEIHVRATKGGRGLDLIGLWPVQRGGGPRYAAIVAEAVERHATALAEGRTVLAGDLNVSVAFRARPGRAFAAVVERLEGLGMAGAYHHVHAVVHGAEPLPTLYWRRQDRAGSRFHIDHVFASRLLLEGCSVSIGGHADWVATGLSDHVPVVAEFAMHGGLIAQPGSQSSAAAVLMPAA